MGVEESRLRAMIDPDHGYPWNLNEEDRRAILWALDAIERLKAERDEIRAEMSSRSHEHRKYVWDIERLIDQLYVLIHRK